MKNSFRLFLIIIIVFFLLFKPAGLKASHMLGAEITWTYVGKDSFLVKLVLYRDCNGIPMSAGPVNFQCRDTSWVVSITPALPAPIDITPVCSGSLSRCLNFSSSFPYGVEKYTTYEYVYLGNAPSRCCELNISYDMSARNTSITTGASGLNFHLEEMMNICQNSHGNSPQFVNDPLLIACVGQNYVFNANSVLPGDPGDSLIYSWSRPLMAKGSPVSWLSPYSYDRPVYFYGFPNKDLAFPRGYHLDSNTGEISFRPMKTEQTVMCLSLSQYRNGVLIGKISRDFQLIVINCTNNHLPDVATSSYDFQAVPGHPLKITIPSKDLDPGDSVRIYYDQSIPGAGWIDSNGLTRYSTGFFKWTPKTSNLRSKPYIFTVKIKDNSCPNTGMVIRTFKIHVIKNPGPAFSVDDSAQCLSGNKFKLENTGLVDSGYREYWDFGDGQISARSNDTVYTYQAAGNYRIALFRLDSTGGKDSAIKKIRVFPDPKPELGGDTTVYDTASVIFDAGPGYASCLWQGNIPGRKFLFDAYKAGSGIHRIFLKVTDANGCTGIDSLNIKVIPFTLISDEFPPDIRFYPNPAMDKLFVESAAIKTNMKILDLSGKMIQIFMIEKGINEVDISKLDKGCYLVIFENSPGKALKLNIMR